jgi:hypothetical protein
MGLGALVKTALNCPLHYALRMAGEAPFSRVAIIQSGG